MKNRFEIRGDETFIYLNEQRGSNPLVTVISTSKLSKAQEFTNSWYAKRERGSFYVRGNAPAINGKRETHLLHRWLVEAHPEAHVDHVNHDTLDNRDQNLRVLTVAQNAQNRLGAQRNSKSGIRGVTRDRLGKWKAQYSLNRKCYYVGSFTTREEAEKAIRHARLSAMPYTVEEL